MLLLLLILSLLVKTISAHVLHASLTRSSVHTPRRVQAGETALNRAAWEQKWNVVQVLLERNADPNITNKVRLTVALLVLVPVFWVGLGLGSWLAFILVLGLGEVCTGRVWVGFG